jgi:hypothetical protein
MDVCVTCNQTIANKKNVEKSYPGRAHWAVVAYCSNKEWN